MSIVVVENGLSLREKKSLDNEQSRKKACNRLRLAFKLLKSDIVMEYQQALVDVPMYLELN